MGNPVFRFKQFTVFHDRCAMKVGTDGILLGAWADITDCSQILDIGTGTGLIALMLAQRSPSHTQIDAIEIDQEAYTQAKENVARSPWAGRIQIIHDSIQTYASACLKRYDLIVANPPFFENTCLSASRTLARHRQSLSPIDLISAADQLLAVNGKLAIIYPTAEQFGAQNLASSNLYCRRQVYIQSTPHSTIKRVLLEI